MMEERGLGDLLADTGETGSRNTQDRTAAMKPDDRMGGLLRRASMNGMSQGVRALEWGAFAERLACWRRRVTELRLNEEAKNAPSGQTARFLPGTAPHLRLWLAPLLYMLVGGETNRGHPPRSPIASAVLRELSKDERWKPLNRLMEGLWQLKSQQEGEELFEECLRMHLEQRRVAVGGGSTQPPPSSDYPSPEPPYVRYLICDSIVLLQRPLTQHATTRTASQFSVRSGSSSIAPWPVGPAASRDQKVLFLASDTRLFFRSFRFDPLPQAMGISPGTTTRRALMNGCSHYLGLFDRGRILVPAQLACSCSHIISKEAHLYVIEGLALPPSAPAAEAGADEQKPAVVHAAESSGVEAERVEEEAREEQLESATKKHKTDPRVKKLSTEEGRAKSAAEEKAEKAAKERLTSAGVLPVWLCFLYHL